MRMTTEEVEALSDAMAKVQRAARCECLSEDEAAMLNDAVDEMLDLYLKETDGGEAPS